MVFGRVFLGPLCSDFFIQFLPRVSHDDFSIGSSRPPYRVLPGGEHTIQRVTIESCVSDRSTSYLPRKLEERKGDLLSIIVKT